MLTAVQFQRNCHLLRKPEGFVAGAIGIKRPASRDLSEGAVRLTHHEREIERLTATIQGNQRPASRQPKATGGRTPAREFEQIFSSQFQPEQAKHLGGVPQTLDFLMNDFFLQRGSPIGVNLIACFGFCYIDQSTRHPLCKRVVEPDGIEPTTSCLQSRRSPS